MKRFVYSLLVIVVFAPTVLAAGCSSNTAAANSSHGDMKMAPVSALPAEMQSAPTTVREAYQFAVANPDALKNVPCYCGCGAMGHTSNYSCFVKSAGTDGKVVFEKHALGCSLCVDIAQEVIKLSQEGKSPGQIHDQVVATFSQYGPSNQ